jgi:hypothetical protein
MPSKELLIALPRQELGGACACDPSVIKDFLFLDAWERGFVPSLSAFLRARQIRRANAVRAVPDRQTGNPTGRG